ncbi:FdtA/QdtA family cupin domain-containing protein [Lutimonas saemankumensis]|uniref:sugar 3,4-ketoisomerase n=1 Tax=Lutimonas saemankumensis TaxID=483016 RepID=UPI001CD344A7|nr:FdtA/QdtA family cupin domain-containing protein [Lutimonas saemankumensis]MCA0932659.1 FdtA/QdtA family cupin domain-containing protein [Lutimonas saemankumensis]
MFTNSTVFDCSVIDLSIVHSNRGNTTVAENGRGIPFDIRRVYYLYDIPGGEVRGGHAHFELEQLVVAASGSFDVVLDDGRFKKRVSLNRPHLALHIVPGLWRELENFSSGSISMVLASDKYDEKDYIRDYDKFINYKSL